MMKTFISPVGESAEYLDHFVCEWPGGYDTILRALELRSRDHLHGLGDLLGILNRLDAPSYVEEVCHELKLTLPLRCCHRARFGGPTIFEIRQRRLEISLYLISNSFLLTNCLQKPGMRILNEAH